MLQPAAVGMADPSRPRMPLNFILPARPSTVAESGLELVLLEELTLRHIVASGTINGADLAKRLHLSLAGIVEEAVNSLRRDGLVDYQSGSANNAVLGLAAMRLRATERGTQVDRLARERSAYIGPAPVSLGAYERMLRQQAMSGRAAPRADVYHAVGHLVLGNDTIDRLGAGLVSGGPILLHGPAGNGKTTIAASIARMFAGAVVVPHAVVIDRCRSSAPASSSRCISLTCDSIASACIMTARCSSRRQAACCCSTT